jgi:hypothetical protein
MSALTMFDRVDFYVGGGIILSSIVIEGKQFWGS